MEEDIISRRVKERERVIREAKDFVNSLKGKFSAFLIGSYARGDFNAWSDVDVLLIGEFSGNPLKRLEEIDFPPGYEVIPLNEEEFRKALEKNNPIVWDVKSVGLILRDDLNLCKKYNLRCSEGKNNR
ncbi:nucleotidyltransferase domain-containing protein [Acidianus sp. HS-5]|uniref:nucleotidyltransferase domain-containing protein n=1 Tax=Acidianus sp. HS-5 TaxID=2886040 RepID=UPI001F1FB515|nr:nucleotidyltransferase domain-containing protein [Acidianus sp. HS-5]BDC17192.1 DNA polymerase subunit beta [Acidianus sp. HS-5]